MNDEANEEQHSHLPVVGDGGGLRPLGHYLGVHFHPAIKLSQAQGHHFAATLAEHFSLPNAQLESNSWTFASNDDNFSIEVTKNGLEVHGESPTGIPERYEQRYRTALMRFEQQFEPSWILASKAMLRGLVPIDGDARVFMAGHVMSIDPDRLSMLDRQLDVLGMRLLMTADEVPGGGSKDCDIDVSLESWVADPSMLWLQVAGKWDEPSPWNDDALEEVIGRLQRVSGYVHDTLLPFLNRNPDQEEG